MNLTQTSPYWPLIKAIGKALTIPGTSIGPGLLVDIQDTLSGDEAQRQLKESLEAVLSNTAAIVQQLRQQDAIEATERDVSEGVQKLVEALYLKRVADKYLYADFKGIEQMEKLVPLKLDDVFVNLRVSSERSASERHEAEPELLRRLAAADPDERERLERHLTDLDAETLLKAKGQGEPAPIDRALGKAGGVVLLGGPGSGKTTLVKRLARSFALGPEVAKERYPNLPWCFPIPVSAAQFDDNRGERNLFDFLRGRFEEEWGRALVEVFLRHWGEGRCLVLVDGLDEVADTGRRIGCARAVGEFVSQRGDNRVLVTSRPVGYSLCRISEPVEHVVLRPFERADIEAFVSRWHVAYDQAVHPERPDRAQAESDARDLMDDIRSNPRVESLAANPLMLTIIALIKHQNVALPERRVELYEIALNTLIRSWNKARSLANRPIGEDLSLADAKKVWADVAHWMHAEKSTGTCSAAQLQQRVVDVLTADGMSPLIAEKTAESYITAAAERSGLLEARGANVFTFMHQTFQEYLAAQHLAKPHRKVVKRIREVSPDPRWHEVIRLTCVR
jgi:predicted NACHT family NTPase